MGCNQSLVLLSVVLISEWQSVGLSVLWCCGLRDLVEQIYYSVHAQLSFGMWSQVEGLDMKLTFQNCPELKN